MKLLLKNVRFLDRILDVGIADGKIAALGGDADCFDQILECSNLTVLPGLIDPHVHVRDLDQVEKEDWSSASKAALAGGITTIFDMPNTMPPTENYKHLNLKRKAAEKSDVKYKLYLGANNSNLLELDRILAEHPKDVCGIKIFLAASSSNNVLSQRDKLAEIFKLAKKYDTVATVHSELQSCLDKWKAKVIQPTIMDHNRLRNRECAILGTELCLELAAEVGNKLYIAHVSTFEEIELIKRYKKDYPIFCEVTPHHLFLNEEILKQVGNYGKVNPPLRTLKDNDVLWEAINDNIVDTIGTDHAPHKINEKNREYSKSPSGFPGLETSLALMNTSRLEGKLDWRKLIALTSQNSAQIFNIKTAGLLEIGKPADLTVFDAERNWKVMPEKFKTKAKYSPWMGKRLKGKVVYTIIDGKVKYEGE